MADHRDDIPESDRPTPVPNPHEGEPTPAPDAHTRPEAEGVTRPDQQEELGPLEGLAHAAAVQVSDSAEAEAEAERLGIEAEGFESAQIFSIMLATAVTLVIAVAFVFYLVASERDNETTERDAVAFYPELQDTRARAAAKLGDYGRQEEVYQMPITAAMESVADDYAARQQGSAVTPAPASFNMVYLDANTADRMRGATSMDRDLSMQESDAEAMEADADGEAGGEAVAEEPEDG